MLSILIGCENGFPQRVMQPILLNMWKQLGILDVKIRYKVIKCIFSVIYSPLNWCCIIVASFIHKRQTCTMILTWNYEERINQDYNNGRDNYTHWYTNCIEFVTLDNHSTTCDFGQDVGSSGPRNIPGPRRLLTSSEGATCLGYKRWTWKRYNPPPKQTQGLKKDHLNGKDVLQPSFFWGCIGFGVLTKISEVLFDMFDSYFWCFNNMLWL